MGVSVFCKRALPVTFAAGRVVLLFSAQSCYLIPSAHIPSCLNHAVLPHRGPHPTHHPTPRWTTSSCFNESGLGGKEHRWADKLCTAPDRPRITQCSLDTSNRAHGPGVWAGWDCLFTGTCGHGADEHGIELEHRAEGLLAVRGAHGCLAVALQQQLLILFLQQHEEVLQQQHVEVWRGVVLVRCSLLPTHPPLTHGVPEALG